MRTHFTRPTCCFRSFILVALGAALGGMLSIFWNQRAATIISVAHAQVAGKPTNPDLTALQAEVQRLKAVVPDQSHAMADVGYHFANLWSAAEKKNWPLAKFYLDETRSHLKWAVRIIPVRKDSAGREVDLKAILDAVDSSLLAEINKAIDNQDAASFTNAYRQTIVGCYSCHKASSKSYLRPQVPNTPPVQIINFNPEAKWPE